MSSKIFKERYSAGYSSKLIQNYERRKISREAAFFAPYLKSGMNLLDCGCGPGTITIGLAQLVTPGYCTAFDIEPSQIKRAKENALNENVENIDFRVTNAYELPFPDEYFDAAFAHTLLQHIKDPVACLREICRVLKPGGIIGVRDDDCSSIIIAPEAPLVRKVISLLDKHMKFCGGNPNIGRDHRALLRKAGFENTQGSASTSYHGTDQDIIRCARLGEELLNSKIIEISIEQGWIMDEDLDVLREALREWGQHPDAFEAVIMCEAVGWKPL
ncbi:hypothetical protein AB835_13710 [Candidatus Endobugula sertula]|uniref:Methyltransferase domain-containing protein n=1 Tax=Candidatus Endobugula sertula TaxID=62101 RepID=A0A1D2QLS1_9GAMM|nr:hypothetical protein AB835_13710 [Candidatus Endobugula sertula]